MKMIILLLFHVNRHILYTFDYVNLCRYNTTCFAYGMTGAGKTYTMMGDVDGEYKVKGLYSYTIDDIFHRIEVCSHSSRAFCILCCEMQLLRILDEKLTF